MSLSAAEAVPTVEERLARLEQALPAASTPAINSGDNAWMLVSSALVLMMTAPGLILFYGGLVRSKNVLGHHDAQPDPDGGGVGAVDGLRLQHGVRRRATPSSAIRCSYFFLQGVGGAPNPDYAATIPQQTFMLFQMMFAIITPALISGAVAERIKFSAYLLFMLLWVTRRLFSAVPHGLGQGRLFQLGAGRQDAGAGFRRRHGGAHQFRRVGAGLRAGAGQARRVIRTSRCCRTTWC